MHSSPRVPSPYIPDCVTDYDELKLLIFATVESVDPKDLIRIALTKIGFTVQRIQKHWFHDVWEVRFVRPPETVDEPLSALRRRIRVALKSEYVEFDPQTLVVSPRGRQVQCALICQAGEVGVYRTKKSAAIAG